MYKLDGELRVATLEDIREGHILRMGTCVPNSAGGMWVSSAFSDNIILKVEKPNEHGTVWVTLVRPFAYVHLTGTTSPGPLFGNEEYKVEAKRLCGGDSIFRLVLMSTGKPAIMNLDRERT